MLARITIIIIKTLLYIVSPGSFFTDRYMTPDENSMLLRMTVNICYYTAIIAAYFIIDSKLP